MDFKSPLSKSRTSLEVYIMTFFQRRELVYRHTSNSIFQRQELTTRGLIYAVGSSGHVTTSRSSIMTFHFWAITTYDVSFISLLRITPSSKTRHFFSSALLYHHYSAFLTISYLLMQLLRTANRTANFHESGMSRLCDGFWRCHRKYIPT